MTDVAITQVVGLFGAALGGAVLGAVQASATTLILVFATRFAGQRCESHRGVPGLPTASPAGDEHPAAAGQSAG